MLVMPSLSKKLEKDLLKNVNLDQDYSQSQINSLLASVSNLFFKDKLSYFSNAGIIRLCICISSHALDADSKGFRLSVSYFKMINEKPNIDIHEFMKLTLITYDKLLDILGVDFLDLISKNIKEKCNQIVENIQPITKNEVVINYKKLKGVISQFHFNSSLSNSLETSINFLLNCMNENTNKSVKASKALAYLIAEDDALPDNLGIFGIADDVYVLENTAFELGGLKYGEEIFSELSGLTSAKESIYINDNETLRPLSRQLQLLLIKINFLTKDNGRYVFVLPDQGPSAYLYLLNKIVDDSLNNRKEAIDVSTLSKGDHLYFRITEGFVEVQYRGISEYDGSNLIKFKFEDDEDHSINFYPLSILEYAFKNIHKDSKIYTKKRYFKNRFYLDEQFLPKKLKDRSINLDNIVMLTEKNKFDEIMNGISPFGARFHDLICFEYFKRKRSGEIVSEVLGNAQSKVKLFSDAYLAAEYFRNNTDNPLTVITDSHDLGDKFLHDVSEIYLRKAENLLFFYPQHQRNKLQVCQEKKFEFCFPGQAFSEMEKPKQYSKESSIIYDFEKILYNSYYSPNLIPQGVINPIIDTFLDLSKKAERECKNNDYSIILQNIYLNKNKLLWNPIPFNEIETQINEKNYRDLLDLLDHADDEPLTRFKEFLIAEKEEIFKISKSRKLIDCINRTNEGNVFVLARTYPEQIKMQAYFERIGRSDIEVIYIKVGQTKSYNNPIVVPVIPGFHLTNLLTHTKISSEIILNLTHEETKQFKVSAKKANNWQNVLVKLNKNTFKKSRVVTKRKIEEVNVEINEHIKEGQDSILGDLINKKFGQKSASSSDIRLIKETILARSYSIQDSPDILFLPRQSKIIIYDFTQEQFLEKNIEEITDDTVVLIKSDNNGDPYDEICNYIDPQYQNKRSKSGEWKIRLRSFLLSNELSIEDLTKKLEGINIKRHPLTVKGWLEKGATIAPSDPRQTLTGIFNLIGAKNITVDDILNSREDVIEARRNAGNKIIEFLPDLTAAEILEKDTISIRLNQSSINMKVVRINEFVSELEIFPNQIWQVAKL
jgi:uncharacterized membrane protein YkvA (DUF1232 family)